MSRLDSSALQAVIGLKADLIVRLRTTQPREWPELVTRFVAALERSNLGHTTAILVLLTELDQELQFMLAGATQADVSRPAWVPALGPRTHACRSEMLASFRRHVLEVLLPCAVRSRPHLPIAGETKRIIDQRYAEPLTLEMLAGAVGRSKRHLGSVFQQEFGQSVHAYLTLVRLNRAMALIQAGEKIEAVSLLVGYRSKKNFYRNFRACFGVTPITCRATSLSQQLTD